LHVLDIAQNSIQAKATLITISVQKEIVPKRLFITVEDNGCGMTEEQLAQVVDPFYTTRTTRPVGLGVPFFKMSAELTGGDFRIESEPEMGTKLTAGYRYDHIDMMPLGDMASTMIALVGANPEIDFRYTFSCDGKEFSMDTHEVKNLLQGLPVNSGEVLGFIRDFIKENQSEIDK